MAANTAPNINGSDPTVLRQMQRQTDAALTRAVTAPPTVGASSSSAPATGNIRSLAPVISGNDVIYPQSTAATSNNAVAINSSLNNDSGDVTTVYTSNGQITVNPVNQTIYQYTSVDSGVSQIVAGNGVTITSTGDNGTGVVTINATANADGNGVPGGSNTQIQFNDNGLFGGSSALTYNKNTQVLTGNTIDLSGNVSANWVIGDYVAGNANPLFHIPGANVSGQVPYAAVANSVSGSNVGGPVANAFHANTANAVSNAAQPNITSVGTLTSLAVTGNATAGNVYANSGTIGALTLKGEGGNISNIQLANVTGIGNIASINLTGSTSDVLYGNGVFAAVPSGNPFDQDLNTTDNVTFANITSTDAIRFSNSGNIVGALGYAPNYVSIEGYGSNSVNITANDVYTWTFDGNGNLTIPNGGYINFVNTGGITQAVNEDLRFTVSDDEQDGWAIESIVNDGAGNNLTQMQVRYDGVRINTDLPTNNYSWDFRDTGEFDVPKSIRGPVGGNLVVSIGDQSGSNTFIDLQTRSYVGDALISNVRIADPNVTISTSNAAHTWAFAGDGNLTVPGSINAINTGGQLGAQVQLIPDLGVAKLAARTTEQNQNYTSADWSSAQYTTTQIDITNAPAIIDFLTNSGWDASVNQTFTINGGNTRLPYTGYATSSNNATIYTTVTADPDPTTVTSIDFYYQNESYFGIDYDDGSMNIVSTGMSIYIDNDQTQGPDIWLRSGDDITIQAKDKILGSEAEGGDINIYAGDGASDDGNGNVSSSGGDIQIVGGQGGFGNSGSGSSGGFARFQGGDGGDAGVGTTAGSGGFVQINAGDGGYNGGNAQLGSLGGYVEIYAGQTTLADGVGGYVDISSGTAADGNGIAGNVRIRTPISATGQGGNWTYDGQGNLTLPNGNPYIKTSDEESTITISVAGAANNRSQFEIGSDGGTDQYTYISSQNDTNGFASFGLNAPNGVPTSAVIGINNGTALDWTFTSAALDDTEAYLYTPAGATITTPNAPSGQTGKNIFIEAGSVDQENYNTNTGGELMLKGGRGGFNDGGGGGPGGNVNINAGESADPAGHAGNVNITAGALTNWTFDYTGNLTLPANTFSVNYANGDPVTFGAAALGNVTFDNVTVQGVNGLNLSAGSDFTANLAYLQVRAGDVASHIHLDTGNNSAYDLILGDDQNYVQVSSTGNILLSAYDSNTAQYTWTLDYNGNLILAGGNSVIQSIANSSLDPLNPNVSTMVLTPDQGYNSQALVLDPTAPGHIHLRAPGANIDEPSANIFLGGEESSFEVGYYTGSAPNVFVHSGNNTWTFDNSGSLSFPRDAGGGTDPYLVINGGTTPAINSVDASLAGPANLQISSDYLNMSGYTGATVTVRADDGSISGSPNLSMTLNAYDDGNSPTVQLINWNSNSGFPTTIVSTETDQVALTTNVNSPNPYGWTFDNTGNLTTPGNIIIPNAGGIYFANGSSYGGGYGDSNVVSLLSSFGSNTISTTGNISTGAVTASGKIGYSTGGNVTQTGTGQGVTLNQLTGEITLAKSSWNAGDIEVFILQTNKVSTGDYIMAQTINSVYATSFNVNAWVYPLLANSVQIYVKALETVTSTPTVKFLIMKAATS